MKIRYKPIVMLLLILILAGCGNRGDGITRTDTAHSYEGYPVVYVVPDVSSQGLFSAYELLELSEHGTTVIQLSDTETDKNFEWTGLIDKLSESLLDSTVIESTQEANLSNYDNTIIVSHFRSHETIGFRGAVKQMAAISAYTGDRNIPPSGQDVFERVAEAGKRTVDSVEGQILYINVVDRLSVESGGITLPDTNTYSVGIFSSYDPVAVDQACVDMLYMIQEGGPLATHIESCHGIDTLIHAEEIGLGSRTYAMTVAEQ